MVYESKDTCWIFIKGYLHLGVIRCALCYLESHRLELLVLEFAAEWEWVSVNNYKTFLKTLTAPVSWGCKEGPIKVAPLWPLSFTLVGCISCLRISLYARDYSVKARATHTEMKNNGFIFHWFLWEKGENWSFSWEWFYSPVNHPLRFSLLPFLILEKFPSLQSPW